MSRDISLADFPLSSSARSILLREINPALTFLLDVRYALGCRTSLRFKFPSHTNCAKEGCFFSSVSLNIESISCLSNIRR